MAPKLCGKCGESLPDHGNYATCSLCQHGLHLDKCSMKTKSWNSLGANQGTWICLGCRSLKKDGSTSSTPRKLPGDVDTGDDEDLEVSSLGVQRSILAKVDSLLEMKVKLDSIEKSMSFLATKYDALLEEVTKLREENKELRKDVDGLKNKETLTRQIAEDVSCEVAELDQYGRRMNLEIQGVTVEGDRRREDINMVLEQVANDIQVPFDPKEIHQAHRLQARNDGKPATILVQFHSRTTRDVWLEKGKKRKLQNIYFTENLCPQYRHLLRETKMRCRTLSYKFVWVKGGRILVRRDEAENNVITIKSMNDLNKIK